MDKYSIDGKQPTNNLKHALKIMRITLFFLFFCILFTYSATSYSQVAALKLDFRQGSIKEFCEEIERKSDFRFIFAGNIKENINSRVNLSTNSQDIEEILEDLLSRTGLSYRILENQIVLFSDNSGSIHDDKATASININNINQQNKKQITGTVLDEYGEPVIGANIIEKGTGNGTVSDFDGEFVLDIEGDATLHVSYIGYISQDIAINDNTSIRIILKEDTQALEELVIVGYGVQKKVNLTGAVSTIHYDEELENRPITNASQAISGKIPGVWVSQNTGQPGNDAARIRVRGWGTLNDSNPLIIIDGVEGDLATINPRDIESISVLKDAASSAIYGSKAANGVVLVTTKKGSPNEEIQVNLSSYFGVQQLGRRYNLITNSAEHMRITNQALANEGGSPLFPEAMVASFENGTDVHRHPNADWYNVLFDNASIQEHNLSIMGGSNRSTTFMSFNYLNQGGMVPNVKSQRYGMRANMGLKINDRIHIDGRINYNRRISEEPYNGLRHVFDMLSGVTPYTSPYTVEGNYGAVEAITNEGDVLYDNRNPLIDANNGKRKTERNFLSLNISTDINLTNSLLWKSNVSSHGTWNMIDNYNQTIEGFTSTGVPMMTKNYNREGIEISRAQDNIIINNLFSTLNYNNRVREIHDISAIFGLQLEDRRINNSFARRSNPPKEGLTQVDAGTTGIQGQGNMQGLRMFSYFGRLNYALADKYLFEFNLRADASSRFKKENRWGFFPGLSLGWRLSEEPFMKDQDIISNLKPRISWGELGNQNIAGYWPYLTTIEQTNNLSYSHNGTFAPGAAVTSLIDENITWETTSSLDVGLDVGLLNNKIVIEADYFYKKTSDIIVQLPIPLMMGGLTPPYENVGEMVNKGVELTLNLGNQQFDRNQFGYNLGLNLTYVDNKVTKFRGGDSPDQLYLIREGYSFQTLYGYKAVGIYQSDEEAEAHMHENSFKPIAGNLKFEDVNNDGKLGFEDKQEIGNTIPKFSYGLTSSFNYKGFDLNFLFQGLAGIHGYNYNDITSLQYEYRTISTKWRNAWSPTNRDTDVPILYFDNAWNNQQSSYWAKDLSFLKLKNVQLGYDIPEKIVSQIGFEKIYLYLNAQNVFVIVNRDFEGYDPEKDTFSHGVNLYPVPRILSFGINLNF